MPVYEFEYRGGRFEKVLSYEELLDCRDTEEDGTYHIEYQGKVLKAQRIFSSGCLARSPQWAVGNRSLAMAVSPDDAEATQKRLRKVTGYKEIEVDKASGEVITYSQRQKNAAVKAMGLKDMDGGYGT